MQRLRPYPDTVCQSMSRVSVVLPEAEAPNGGRGVLGEMLPTVARRSTSSGPGVGTAGCRGVKVGDAMV
jgi:hypothetical protein